ncbi:MAG: DUF859 domain-containing protein [Sphaerochaetaceae bacterium]|nr:DUF859 domain-containing protein [Sphaerochaetaceae bacterium]
MAIKFVNTPGISQIQLYLEVIEGTQDVVNNRTTVTYKAYLYNQYYNYYYNWNDTSMTVTVNGTVVATNSAVKYDFRTGPREQAVLTGTAVIPHNSDGTKTLAASVALEGPSYRGPGTVTLNLSLPLTTIPRATEFTAMSAFNSSSTSISVTADVKSTAFTNKFSLVVNSKPIGTWTNPTFSSGNASLALSTTHHNNLLAALPTQTSATATMTLQTLSGTTVIGTRTKSATYTILADVKPVITSSTIGNVPTTGAISGTERAYAIQGVSAISVSWSHTIPTGTTLASGTVSMGGVTKNTNPASFQATTAGTNTAVITVKDKRGRIGTKSLSIDVTAYSPISAQLLYLGRPRAEGSNQARLQAEVKHVVSPLSGNKYDVIIQTKEVGTSTWTTVLNSRYTPNATHTRVYDPTTVYDELKAFDTMITVADDYSTATLLGVLPTAAYPLVIGKYGIGVGKVPQGDRVLDVGGDIYAEDILLDGESVASHLAESASKHITESGSNENGNYIKFDDGTMICFFAVAVSTPITAAAGALFTSADVTWTYPATFPYGESPAISVSAAGGWSYIRALANASVRFKLINSISGTSAFYTCIAIGRWK